MVTTAPAGNIQPVRIEDEMRTSYLSYAMSVIVSRALPDARDGMKPVQRRILYSMHEMGIRPASAYRKSARIVGEVMGKYHPHGDSPVYEALVRMAQDFSMRYPLIDGQGNFGSIDNDPPAAMRYTEARLASIAEELLTDIDLNTVDFTDNFDGSLKEPTVLPGLLPNMLVNGASGIAVGMATNIPPHNLGEICDAVVYLIDHPDAVLEELMERVTGPDFPTSATIQGRSGIVDAYRNGQGRVVMQAKADIEELRGGRKQIIVTEIPYQVNKASLVEKIAHLIRDKKIEGVSDVRDESDRHGLRVVIELRRDVQAEIVLNNLYRHTALRSSFNVIMLALVDGQPQVLSLKRSLQIYIEHRQNVITRRSEHQLKVAKDRAHILEGLRKALERLDEVISIIRNSQDAAAARENLMERLDLSQVQAQAILDMQLRRLAALERERIEEEYRDLLKTIADLEALLGDPAKVLAVVKEDTEKLKKRSGDPRRTEILEDEVSEISRADMVLHQDMIVTLSQRGYIKRIPATTYKIQHRGGKGIRGMTTREDDALQELLVADTHDVLLFFTNRGRAYPLRCFDIPGESSRTSRGTPLSNLIPLAETERVNAVVAVSDEELRGRSGSNGLHPTDNGSNGSEGDITDKVSDGVGNGIEGSVTATVSNGHENGAEETAVDEVSDGVENGNITDEVSDGGGNGSDGSITEATTTSRILAMATRMGEIKAMYLSNLAGIRPMGLNVMNLEDGDEMVSVRLAQPTGSVMMVTSRGMAIYFPISDTRPRSRTAGGVRGIRLEGDDRVIALEVAKPEDKLLTISALGYGKLVNISRFREGNTQARGGKGLTAAKVDADTGPVADAKVVDGLDYEVMLVSAQCQVFRTSLVEIKEIQGRKAKGVIVWRPDGDDQVASIACYQEKDITNRVSGGEEDESDVPLDTETPTSEQGSRRRRKGADKEKAEGGQLALGLEEEI